MYDKKDYVVHIKNLQQPYGIKWTKVHKVIKFKQKEILKPYLGLNTKLRTNAKNNFEKDFYKLRNNCFLKNHGECEKHWNIKIVTSDKRRNQLVSEPIIKQMNDFLKI